MRIGSLFDIELVHAQTQANVCTSLISIYKAMGGGWVDEAGDLAPTVDEVMSNN